LLAETLKLLNNGGYLYFDNSANTKRLET
jgi:hypothetical protein